MLCRETYIDNVQHSAYTPQYQFQNLLPSTLPIINNPLWICLDRNRFPTWQLKDGQTEECPTKTEPYNTTNFVLILQRYEISHTSKRN